MTGILRQLAQSRRNGAPFGITSVCSAHPIVIRAAARNAARVGGMLLIEATCNQVNQFGGYTGMLPHDFVRLVQSVAAEERLSPENIIFGGDHLGPNPWRNEPSEGAMAKAEEMVTAYVSAGFRKLHLDASMGCAGEPAALDDATTAARALRLAQAAETAALRAGGEMPLYVIGTEVPPPGGAHHVITHLEPTSVSAARNTIDVHRELFLKAGLGDAFARVVALVVQPGVEFGNQNVVPYDRARAQDLSQLLRSEANFVYEAHSTDYQGRDRLAELVEDGFAILKVGPELTFSFRQALYGLDLIASECIPDYPSRNLMTEMEALMRKQPDHWKGHYLGSEIDQHIQRHYSYSDRIRYYWNHREAEAAVSRLMEALEGRILPAPLFLQHLPSLASHAGKPLNPQELLIDAVEAVLGEYRGACQPLR